MEEKLESISETLVLADVSNFSSMTSLLQEFEAFEKMAQESAKEILAKASAASAALIWNLISGDSKGTPTPLLDILSKTVSLFQDALRKDHDPSNLDFPIELGLKSGNNSESTSAVKDKTDEPGTRMPDSDYQDILKDFIFGAEGKLEEIEALLLKCEKKLDRENIQALKRIFHTLKGESGLLELSAIETICHKTEDQLSEDCVTINTEILFQVKDWLSKSLLFYSGKCEAPDSIESIFNSDSDTKLDFSPENVIDVEFELLGFFISESLEHMDSVDANLLTLETNPDCTNSIHAIFRSFHSMKGAAASFNLMDIKNLAHETETLLDKIRNNELHINAEIIDIVFDSVDLMRSTLDHLKVHIETGEPLKQARDLVGHLSRIHQNANNAARDDASPKAVEKVEEKKKLGDILIEKGIVTPKDVDVALQKQAESKASGENKKLGELLIQEGTVSAKKISEGLRKQFVQKPVEKVVVKEQVKVDSERLDKLVDTIGELVIAEAMVRQSDEMQQIRSIDFKKKVSFLGKISREIQNIGTSMRMVPLHSTFQKMARIVRDISKKTGKLVEFTVSGEETELDKAVVDRIGDPLIHIIRNAVDHGIEKNSEARKAAGKAEKGRVFLRASHSEGKINIEIEDDGRGLDKEKIMAKAIERGLLKPDSQPSDQEIWSLVFEPGLTTAKELTDISGRGVGMDVVKKNIEALRGQVDIKSRKGHGSTFTIRLPLTLAIIEGMEIRVGSEQYIIPTISVLSSVRPKRPDITTVAHRGEMFSYRKQLLPLIHLGKLFVEPEATTNPTKGLIVIIEHNGRQAGLVVDELVGKHQVVIKNLGELFQNADLFSGGAIMPSGNVALVLDIGSVLDINKKNEMLNN